MQPVPAALLDTEAERICYGNQDGCGTFSKKAKGDELFAFFIIMNKVRFLELRKTFAAKTIDELIELLSDEVLLTRFLAEMCLRDATNT